jgi:hypothetical protein
MTFANSSRGSTASVVRLLYVPRLSGLTLHFYNDAVLLGIWSAIELALGITAGCLATLRPLLRGVLSKARELRREPCENIDCSNDRCDGTPGTESVSRDGQMSNRSSDDFRRYGVSSTCLDPEKHMRITNATDPPPKHEVSVAQEM